MGIFMLKCVFGLSLLLLSGMLVYLLQEKDGAAAQSQADYEAEDEDEMNLVQKDVMQFKHIITCVMCCLHALALLLHG